MPPLALNLWASQVALVIENPPANAGDLRDEGSIWEDPLEKGMAIHPSIIAGRISWTEEHGRLQSVGLQIIGRD